MKRPRTEVWAELGELGDMLGVVMVDGRPGALGPQGWGRGSSPKPAGSPCDWSHSLQWKGKPPPTTALEGRGVGGWE